MPFDRGTFMLSPSAANDEILTDLVSSCGVLRNANIIDMKVDSLKAIWC